MAATKAQAGKKKSGAPMWIVLVIGATVVNVVGFMAYRSLRGKQQAGQPDSAQTTTGAPQQDISEEAARASALRIQGLAALESGDYNDAVKKFSEAVRLTGASKDLPELLRIAKELQDRRAQQQKDTTAAAAPEDPAPEDKADEPDAKKSSSSSSRSSSRSKPKTTSAPKVEEPPKKATLLVTSTPSGLLVELDGVRTDLTPAKLPVDAGSHTVAIIKGSEKLFEKKVTASAGGVYSVDADLTEKLAPPVQQSNAEPVAALQRPMPSEPPQPKNVEPEAKPEPPKAQEPAPAKLPDVKPAQPPASSGAGYGSVEVISRNIYGEVYINGTSYGFPPIVAKKVPVGQAVVEIRVDGEARRSKTVDVTANDKVEVRFR